MLSGERKNLSSVKAGFDKSNLCLCLAEYVPGLLVCLCVVNKDVLAARRVQY